MRTNIALLFVVVLGCSDFSDSDIVPFQTLDKVSSYHCWPYDVNVYLVNNIKIDSLFYTYPHKSFFGENTKYKITTWTKYDEVDTMLWYGMDETLEQCDDNIELYNQRLKGGDIYYAGRYQYMKNRQGEKRREYDRILFLDLANNKLHIFQDINKVNLKSERPSEKYTD